MQLSPGKGPIEVIVVDRVRQPTGNYPHAFAAQGDKAERKVRAAVSGVLCVSSATVAKLGIVGSRG